MSQQTSLREVERRVFQVGFQDGLWDILIGLLILAFALAPVLSESLGDFWSSVVLFGTWPLLLGLISLVRKYVVSPRLGAVQFGPSRMRRLMRFNMAALIVLTASLLLGVGAFAFSQSALGVVLGWVPMASLGLTCLVLCSVAAYFLDYPRLYVYGMLLVVAPLAGEWLYQVRRVPHHGIPVTFGFTAAVVIAVGLVKFIQLLRAYPASDAQQPS